MIYEYLRWFVCFLGGFAAGCGATAWYIWRFCR